MVDFINNTLSYDFLPSLFNFIKIMTIITVASFILFISLAIIAFILKDIAQKIMTTISTVVGVIFIISAFIAAVSIIMVPVLFCIIGIKNGIMEFTNIPEVVCGLISSFFCMCILSVLAERLFGDY